MPLVLPSDRRVCQRVGVATQLSSNLSAFISVNPGGPAGSALMSFFAVVTILRAPTTTTNVWSRGGGLLGSTGWGVLTGTLNVAAGAGNSTPAIVQSADTFAAAGGFGVPLIIVGRYNSGNMRVWINGVESTAVNLGAGYTALATATRIGGRNCVVHDCGMFDTYDIAATAVTQTNIWKEDLQQGRYLTMPFAMTVNDTYFCAKDVVINTSVRSTWVDRGPNALSLTPVGVPTGASYPMRFM